MDIGFRSDRERIVIFRIFIFLIIKEMVYQIVPYVGSAISGVGGLLWTAKSTAEALGSIYFLTKLGIAYYIYKL